MKHQALFSSRDKSKKIKSVVCCNFAWQLINGLLNNIQMPTEVDIRIFVPLLRLAFFLRKIKVKI